MEPLLSPEQISRFYDGWSESKVHREWAGLWRKQFKACACIDTFISLNRKRSRLGFQTLRTFCQG